MKKRRIGIDVWEIGTCLLVFRQAPKTRRETGHTRTVGYWKDAQNKFVGYTLADCIRVAEGRKARGEFPFPLLKEAA